MSRRDLEALTKRELCIKIRALGLPVGRTLKKAQLVELLLGLEEDESGTQTESREEVFAPVDSAKLFATVSLARLLAAQGMASESIEVCRAVLREDPHEPRARELLGVLSRTADSRESREKEPASSPLPTHRRFGWSRVLLLTVDPQKLWVSWEVSDEGDERAANLAGVGARRVLRLFSAHRGVREIERLTRDMDLSSTWGRLNLDRCRPAASHTAAVGWLSSGSRFVPSAHSAVVWTPAAGVATTSHAVRTLSIPLPTAPLRGRSLEGLLQRWRSALGPDSIWPEFEGDAAVELPDPILPQRSWLRSGATSPGGRGGDL